MKVFEKSLKVNQRLDINRKGFASLIWAPGSFLTTSGSKTAINNFYYENSCRESSLIHHYDMHWVKFETDKSITDVFDRLFYEINRFWSISGRDFRSGRSWDKVNGPRLRGQTGQSKRSKVDGHAWDWTLTFIRPHWLKTLPTSSPNASLAQKHPLSCDFHVFSSSTLDLEPDRQRTSWWPFLNGFPLQKSVSELKLFGTSSLFYDVMK